VDNSTKSLNIFLGKIFLLYIFWLVSENFLSHELAFYGKFWAFCYHILLKVIHGGSELVLHLLGYETVSGYNSLAIVGTYGVIIGNPCVGFGLTFGFSALIISYPGPWKRKLWFIPAGAAFIALVNIIRVVALMTSSYKLGGLVKMEQHDLFNNLIYIVIFLLWVIWVKFIVDRKKKFEA
jgi:exosortase/archaeosortase family protein